MDFDEKRKQEKLKLEAEQKIKSEIRKQKRRVSKAKKHQEAEMSLLVPKFKNNKVEWNRKGNSFEGYFDSKLMFEIKPGILTFSLRLKDRDIIKYFRKNGKSSSFSSTELTKLQKKANDILLEAISRS